MPKLVVMPPLDELHRSFARRLPVDLPDYQVVAAETEDQARAELADADAAFGWIPPALLPEAKRLRWLHNPPPPPPPPPLYAAPLAAPTAPTARRTARCPRPRGPPACPPAWRRRARTAGTRPRGLARRSTCRAQPRSSWASVASARRRPGSARRSACA